MKRFVQRFAGVCFGARTLAVVVCVAVVMCAATARAQGVRYNDVVRTKDNRPLSNGTVAVCVANPTDPGNVGQACQPLATIYTDATLSTPAANPILADTNGNFWFWAAPGTYFVEFYSPGRATEPFSQMITLGFVPNATAAGCGSTGTSQNNTWTGTNTFGADAYFKSGEPWFDVKAFGAKCDDTADDTTAIQATIGAIPATGGLVTIPGVCKFTSTLVINKPDVTIEGKGHFQFITQNAPVTYLDFQGATGNAILVSAQGFKMQNVGIKYPTTIGGPIAPPAAPVLTQVAGSGCPAEPYYVQTTYVNPQGETSDSAEATFATTSGNCLQVQSPSTVVGATGWNLYVSANPNNETKQNATPIAIGTSWTFGGTLVNLAYRPPFNTIAYSAIYDNNGAQLNGVKLFTNAAASAGTANMANGYTSFGCCGKLNDVYVAGFGVGIAGAGANNDFSVTDSYIQSNNVGAFVVNGADINFTQNDFEGNVVGNIKMLYGSPYTLSHNYFEQQGTNPPSYNVQVGDTSIPPQGFTPTPGAIVIDGNFMQCNLTAYPPAPIVVDIAASLDIEKNSFSQCGNQNIIANFAGAGATIKVLGNISDTTPLAWTTSTTGFVESDLNGTSMTPGTPVFFGLGVTGNLSVSTLTSGNCVQAGTGGLLTTAANPCGAGGGTLGTITPQPAHAGDVICANGTPTWTDCVQGITGRTVSGTSDTIVAADRGTTIAYTSASAAASSLTSAATLGNNFYSTVNVQGAGTVTLTPTAGQINGAASLAVVEGQTCYVHSPDNVNYTADCNNGQITWGNGLTLTRTAHGVSVTPENRSYFGNVTLAGGTGTFTLPGGDSFTSTATFGCTANDTTTVANGVKAVPATTTTATVTGTGTDVISVTCVGH
ncbi:MAG: hypothetical protein ACRD4H_01560 [Candidatus Acidiferrales bacterium]